MVVEILKYFVEERKISDELKITLLGAAAKYGRLDCLQYLVEEAKAPLNNLEGFSANARYYEHPDLNYLLEKGAQNQRTKNTLGSSSKSKKWSD